MAIPGSVTSIGDYAFDECDKAADAFCGGTEAKWQAAEILDSTEALHNAAIRHNATQIHDPEHIPGKAADCTEAGGQKF